jgi:hypothetical protein
LVFERPAPTDDAILVMSSTVPEVGDLPDDVSADRPTLLANSPKEHPLGFKVLHARLMGMCQDAGMTDVHAQDHVVRWWAMAHGLTSLRLHKPAGLWQHDVDVDVRALVALMSPAAEVRLRAQHSL